MTTIAGIIMGACFETGMVSTPGLAAQQAEAVIRRLARAGVGFTFLEHAASLAPQTGYPALERNLAAADDRDKQGVGGAT